jgi:ATP-dependent Clp protease ATP-binding subunit ClpC
MFERYTELALRTLFFARYEATQLGGTSIGPEHVLLGLLRESGAIVGPILVDADISYQGVRKQIDELTQGRPKLPTSVDIPLSAETERIFSYAAEEADGLAHPHIGTEHLLLGLLRERGTLAERRLAEKGLSVDLVRERIRDTGASSSDESISAPSRVETLMALQRASSLLEQLNQINNPDTPDIVESIQFELELVRRGLMV